MITEFKISILCAVLWMLVTLLLYCSKIELEDRSKWSLEQFTLVVISIEAGALALVFFVYGLINMMDIILT